MMQPAQGKPKFRPKRYPQRKPRGRQVSGERWRAKVAWRKIIAAPQPGEVITPLFLRPQFSHPGWML